jgi:hypothetical protein
VLSFRRSEDVVTDVYLLNVFVSPLVFKVDMKRNGKKERNENQLKQI